MSQNPPSNPVVGMINRIRQEMFERIYRGQINYAVDIKTIKKHIEIAIELNEPLLASRLYQLGGFMSLVAGELSEFDDWYQQAFNIAQEHQFIRLMAITKMNHGEAYRLLGRYDRALALYQASYDYFLEDDQKDNTLPLLESNIGLAQLGNQNYDAAEGQFLKALAQIGQKTYDHVDALMEAKRGLAEVELNRGDFETAWKNIEEATRLAIGINDKMTLAEINLTRAHIAEQDPDHDDAPLYYTASRALLKTQESPVVLARALLDEARYQHRHQAYADAKKTASEAHTIFTNLNMLEDAALAAELM